MTGEPPSLSVWVQSAAPALDSGTGEYSEGPPGHFPGHHSLVGLRTQAALVLKIRHFGGLVSHV